MDNAEYNTESLARAFHVKNFKERTPAEQKAWFIRICTWRDYALFGWFHEWLKAVGVMDPKRFAEGGKFKAAPRSINLKIVEEGLRWLSSAPRNRRRKLRPRAKAEPAAAKAS